MDSDHLKATELDKATSTYNLQMLKAALTYFPPQSKRLLSVWIKAQEFKNTLQLFSSPESEEALSICSAAEQAPKRGFFDVLNEIKDYGSPEQRKAFERLNNLITLSSLYDQMSQNTAETASKEMASKETPNEEKEDLKAAQLSGEEDFGSYIRNSLPPDKKALFDSYTAMFRSSKANKEKETPSL